jgi:hypothetical protein
MHLDRAPRLGLLAAVRLAWNNTFAPAEEPPQSCPSKRLVHRSTETAQ